MRFCDTEHPFITLQMIFVRPLQTLSKSGYSTSVAIPVNVDHIVVSWTVDCGGLYYALFGSGNFRGRGFVLCRQQSKVFFVFGEHDSVLGGGHCSATFPPVFRKEPEMGTVVLTLCLTRL